MRISATLRFRAAGATALGIFLLTGLSSTLARQEAPGSIAPATLRGRVLLDDRTSPVRQARVTVTVGGRSWGPVFTDDQGQFQIDVPDVGAPSILVMKTGFVPALSRGLSRTSQPFEIYVARSGILAGRVVDSAGRPVVNVQVRARRQGGASKSPPDGVTRTNDLGEFRIAQLPKGEYAVATDGMPEASMMPYSDSRAAMEQERPDQPTSDPVLATTQSGQETGVTLVYRQGAVILPYANVGGLVAGRLIDEFGEPVPGLNVQLWHVRFENGQRTLQPASPMTQTDDRGQYRMFHVPAGRYLVVAMDDSSRYARASSTTEFLPVYYPGRTAPADAFPLQVDPRQQLTGVDMVVTWVRGARIFGTAIDSLGRPLTNPVTLRPSDRSGTATLPQRTTTVRPDGTFEFLNLPPGSYILRGSASSEADAVLQAARDAALKEMLAKSGRLTDVPNPTIDPETRSRMRPSESAILQIAVDRADTGPITLRTSPTATLRGLIVFEGSAPPPGTQASEFSVRAFTAEPDLATASAGSLQVAAAAIDARNSTFEMSGLAGTLRIALASAPSGWWIKSAFIGPTNAAEDPVTFTTPADSRDDVSLVLANTAASITGSAVDESGRAAADCWIIVMAVDSGRWFPGSPYVRAALSNQTGRFTVASLPPGEYWVTAVDVVEGDTTSGEWQHAELLDALAPRARRVVLAERQRLEQRVVRITR